MKCIVCKNYSLKLICRQCQDTFLRPKLLTRKLPDGFVIYSFYHYSDVSELLKTKHRHIGATVYAILAQNSFKKFAENFRFENLVYALPVDDKTQHGYAHTAILAKALKSPSIEPVYACLHAQNSVTYASKTLQYRLENPRDFLYTFKSDIDAIIVDDLVTTTTTINEAKNCLQKEGVNPLFAITLADAKQT